jgi:hypothetical protein
MVCATGVFRESTKYRRAIRTGIALLVERGSLRLIRVRVSAKVVILDATQSWSVQCGVRHVQLGNQLPKLTSLSKQRGPRNVLVVSEGDMHQWKLQYIANSAVLGCTLMTQQARVVLLVTLVGLPAPRVVASVRYVRKGNTQSPSGQYTVANVPPEAIKTNKDKQHAQCALRVSLLME